MTNGDEYGYRAKKSDHKSETGFDWRNSHFMVQENSLDHRLVNDLIDGKFLGTRGVTYKQECK